MKLLNGLELAGFIKQRQAKEVRSLKQGQNILPKLAIVQTKDDPVINTYVRLKQRYGADIGVDVELFTCEQQEVKQLIDTLNNDQTVHGVIVQLPLEDPKQTEAVVNMVSSAKDVDALGSKPIYDPATPMAILWLLAGYNVDLKNKKIVLIGRGKLVGAPLEKILQTAGHDVEVIGRDVSDIKAHTIKADIIITATGSPAILNPDMIKKDAVVVDAGVASESGKTVGDLELSVYERDDLIITPQKGGVGPLTVCALFENVIRAARQTNV